jgi:hypothetical protein
LKKTFPDRLHRLDECLRESPARTPEFSIATIQRTWRMAFRLAFVHKRGKLERLYLMYEAPPSSASCGRSHAGLRAPWTST